VAFFEPPFGGLRER